MPTRQAFRLFIATISSDYVKSSMGLIAKASNSKYFLDDRPGEHSRIKTIKEIHNDCTRWKESTFF